MHRGTDFYIEWRTQVDRRRSRSRVRLCRRLRQSQQRQQRRNAQRLLAPVQELGLLDLVFHREGVSSLVRVGRGCFGDTSSEAVGNREQLRDTAPFFPWRLMESF